MLTPVSLPGLDSFSLDLLLPALAVTAVKRQLDRGFLQIGPQMLVQLLVELGATAISGEGHPSAPGKVP